MIRYYVYQYYLNAEHSMGNDRSSAHPHTFSITLYIGGMEKKSDIPFYQVDERIKNFFREYNGQYLNDLPVFAAKEPNIETIGDVLYEALKGTLESVQLQLFQLDISENPLCVYQVSDRILLPTTSMKQSEEIFDKILLRKQQLMALSGKEL